MSVLVRVVRQFHEGVEAVRLAKTLVLTDVPTMGTRPDLRVEGVENALTVVGVMMRALVDGAGLKEPGVEVWLIAEPLAAAEMARAA